jgi:tagatose 1,6-diphosphate aldolase
VEFNGVLCGRATWQDGVPIYVKEGAQAFENWLNTKGAENIEKVNSVLKGARPWYDKLGMGVPALS